jgi:hypothetical protein
MSNIAFHHPRIWNWSILFLAIIMSSFVFTVSSTTVHAAQVTLAWDRNAETNVEGYKVYYGTTSRDYDWVIDVGDVTSITITDLTDGFTYYFAATAYDTATPPLESAFSGEVSKNTCSYSISPTSTNFTVSGGTGSVSVTTQAGCPWTASSGAVWMTITSGSSGTGNGTVNYSISSNTGSSRTSGSTIAGRVFTVTQSGATTYTITATAGTGGSISPSGSVSVAQGGSQTFSIAANTGYQISSVTVDGVSQGAISSYTFSNVTAAHTISATFAVRTYAITASAGTGGSISPTGSVSVNHGANQTFTITPNTGYSIASVTVDGVSQGAIGSYTFSNVTAAHTISATFAVRTYTITASAGTGGSISPTGSVSVNHGANQTFTITPNTGYTVSNIVVDGSSVGAVTTYTFSNVTAAHTISATFSVRTYAITASAGTGGTITPSGSVSVNHGANQIFTITPNTGYSVATVTVDGVSQGAISSYAFSNVTANHTISATFTANSVIISASAGSGGSISPSGAVTVIYGSNQTFIITPTSGYAISNVLVDGVSQGAVGSYAFGNVTTNHTITASFFQITYTINASASAGGTISPSGSVTVAQGANQVFTITQGSGYTIADVLIDGSSAGAVGSYTFTNVSSSHTISASFVEGYTLMVTTTGTGIGEVTPNPAATVYPPGTKVTLRAEKDVSSTFDGFSGDCTSSRTSCTITMNKHTAVTAAFKLKSLKVKTTVIGSGTVSLDEPMSIEDGKKTKNEKKVKQIKRSKHETKVDYGDQLAYNITPEAGNYIKKIVVDGKSHGSVEALTITDVKRNHNVKVKFESEAKLNPHEKFWLIKHKIFLRDTDEQDEQHALNDLPDDDDDDDDPSESPTTSRIASVKK